MKTLKIAVLFVCAIVLQVSAVPNESRHFYSESDLGENISSYRLPNNSLPLRYDLWIKADLEYQDFNFSARVNIHVKIIEPSTHITLHLKDVEVDRIDLLTVNKTLKSSNLRFAYIGKYNFLVIKLPEKLSPNEELILDIQYRYAKFRTSLFQHGFYSKTFIINLSNVSHPLYDFGLTNFKPTHARRSIPCYDEPQIRAVINVRIQCDKSYNVISNMPIVKRDEIANTNYVTSEFKDSPPMPIYLLSFVISNLKYKSSQDARIEQRIYAEPKFIDDGDADMALNFVGLFVKKLEDHLGVEFPFEKIDHIAMPRYPSEALGNFGSIIYKDSRLLYNLNKREFEEKNEAMNVIAFELSQQYFESLVGIKWWSYLWLNRGLAKFYQTYLLTQIYPDIFCNKKMLSFAHNSGEFEKYNDYVEASHDIERIEIDFITNRSFAIIRMFHEALSPKTFTKGIRYYINKMKYSAATPEDLYRELQKAYDEDFRNNGIDVGSAMKTWEDQGGYPELSVKKSGSKFIITQRRKNGDRSLYIIPIFYATKSDPNFEITTPKIWMKTKTVEIEAQNGDDWIILNVNLSGFYTIKYSQKVATQIIKTFQSNHDVIPLHHRAEIFRTFTSQVINGSLPMTHAFKLFDYLQHENNFVMWEDFNSLENYLYEHLFGTEAAEKFDKFIIAFIKPFLKKYGFKDVEGELESDSKFRKLFVPLSHKYNDPEFLQIKLQELKESLVTKQTSESFCHGMKIADEATFMKLFARFRDENTNADIVKTLACSRDKKLLKLFLTTSLEQDSSFETVYMNILKSSGEGLEVSSDFLIEHFVAIANEYEDSLGYQIRREGELFSSEGNIARYLKINKLFEHRFRTFVEEVKRLNEEVAMKKKWFSKHVKEIEALLDETLHETASLIV